MAGENRLPIVDFNPDENPDAFLADRNAHTENGSCHRAMRTRDAIKPPSGLTDHVSRREAAALLGYDSEFKVRQLEKEGRLRAVRGVMRSAWYPRKQVLALCEVPSAPPTAPAPAGATPRCWPTCASAHARSSTWSSTPASRSPAPSGIYRFWLAHDTHATAAVTRGADAAPPERRAQARVTRDGLLAQLRDPAPGVRAAAFAALKKAR